MPTRELNLTFSPWRYCPCPFKTNLPFDWVIFREAHFLTRAFAKWNPWLGFVVKTLILERTMWYFCLVKDLYFCMKLPWGGGKEDFKSWTCGLGWYILPPGKFSRYNRNFQGGHTVFITEQKQNAHGSYDQLWLLLRKSSCWEQRGRGSGRPSCSLTCSSGFRVHGVTVTGMYTNHSLGWLSVCSILGRRKLLDWRQIAHLWSFAFHVQMNKSKF
jgi:hypothetical protein